MNQFKGQKILIVEDNLISYKLVEAHMKGKNLHLVHANDGQQAIEKFEQYPDIDIILMDIQLPNLDGLEVTRKIRKSNKEIPIIATTANVFDEDRIASKEAGCNAFIAKPINFVELFELLNQYLQ